MWPITGEEAFGTVVLAHVHLNFLEIWQVHDNVVRWIQWLWLKGARCHAQSRNLLERMGASSSFRKDSLYSVSFSNLFDIIISYDFNIYYAGM